MPFVVDSLFTNVTIKKTIDIIWKQIYNDHTISTNLKKRSFKKRMSFSLVSAIANIFMIELKNEITKPQMNDGTRII